MAIINNYIGWSTKVNRVILSDSKITLGSNATISTELENGGVRKALRGGYCPDVYTVVMEFNYENKDENGKTELQYFYEWYKYKHKYGTVPFEFPKILYSPMTGIKGKDNESVKTEFYTIKDTVEGSRNGSDIRVQMTWESVYGGVINIPDEELSITSIDVKYGYIDINFNVIPVTIPVSSDFAVKVNIDSVFTQVSVVGIFYESGKSLRLYYDTSLLNKGITYTVELTSSSGIYRGTISY